MPQPASEPPVSVPPPEPPGRRPGLLRRWQLAYAQASPLGKTVRDLGLAYGGYLLLLPLTLLPQFAMSEDNAAGIGEAFQTGLGGSNPYLILAGAALLLTVLAPVVEELLFRGIPLLLRLGLDRVLPARFHRAVSAVLGVASAVVFAQSHNLMPGTLPLPQLWLGLLTWRAASTRGLRYSMLLHGMNNGVVVIIFLLLFLTLGPDVLQDVSTPAQALPLLSPAP
ncbi:CPBP family intramembrane glutamic endopeptidase [Deinococcus sp. Marseille-Q6407]|uniref:CPBP family intramembrane glutamic endopeptidase n=1 Tax=Deinococcus sp. Marseille-Q6407 TaxID=2969223 RepID=UPI0021BFD491|nr:CPBP family intramembrane glutamic endopeptidase [Deinococcus sp. Marseille-Q6407]